MNQGHVNRTLSQSNHLVTTTQTAESALIPYQDIITAGQAANRIAANYTFADYHQRRAFKTIRTQTAALVLWVEYLQKAKAVGSLVVEARQWAIGYFSVIELERLEATAEEQQTSLPIIHGSYYCQHVPAAWQGVTWGLVEGFVKWLLKRGYSVATINNRLSAVKVYVRLAAKAGVISPTEHALIREVRGYGGTEGKRVNMKRPKTRLGYKKAEAIVLTAEQARQIKTKHSPTPQGIRDRLLICLFLDLGLRASEVAALKMEDFAEPGYVTVYRQKTDHVDQMALTADLLKALSTYEPYKRPTGILLRGSRKNEELTEAVMSIRAIGARVKVLGRDILGVWDLSPHDLRHTWATRAAKHSNPFVLRDAGGWSNMQTPSRYVERAKVVNEGIQLDY